MQEQFEGTMPVQEKHRFDIGGLERFMLEHVQDFRGPLQVEQFKGGQSNPTFLLTTPGQRYVLRRKPPGKLLPSAHAVDREYRVISALRPAGIPVARSFALCEDETVIGTAFYIMEFVQGRVFWDQALPGMAPEERRAIYDEMNRVIAALHQVDYTAAGLGDYGKPGSYLERQIARWTKQYRASQTEQIEAMEHLIEWLPQHLPRNDQTAIVHGDYRLDNLMFHPSEPRVLAVLDWELSTLGHPLADFAYHCMSWHLEPQLFRGIGGLELGPLGIPSETEYIRRYCERTGLATPEQLAPDWNFYLAYNMFRIAAILQGIARRWEDGTASSEEARANGARARPMAELAWKYAQKA